MLRRLLGNVDDRNLFVGVGGGGGGVGGHNLIITIVGGNYTLENGYFPGLIKHKTVS